MKRLAAIVVLTQAVGCALILGFEDHEPFPEGSGGQGGGPSAGGGPQGGEGGTPGTPVLLIPDRGTNAIGLYDPNDGHYLADLIVSPASGQPFAFDSPNDAVKGPDGRIYVSDQLADCIFTFDESGTFLGLFADASDGLDNVRGIDFRDGELFASVSPGGAPPFVARFDLQGNRLADFVNDGSDPFDVTFLGSGTMLMANILDPDDVRLYDVNGGSFVELVNIDFPQQISLLPGGTMLIAGWTEAVEAEQNGDVLRTFVVTVGRGIHGLTNGQWLMTSEDGVQVIDPVQLRVTETLRVGTGFTKIEAAVLSSLP